MTKEEPELRLEIDRFQLEKEWVDQPAMMHAWSLQAAEAQLKYDEAKSRLEAVKARLDKEIRDSPADFGIGKVTETVVSNAVVNQKDYQRAVREVNLARYELQIAQAAVNALEHRKRALSMLVELWVHEYYAGPHSDLTPMSEESQEFRKKAIRRRGRRKLEDD